MMTYGTRYHCDRYQWGESSLRHDLQALRREFGCDIRHRAGSGYQLLALGELHLLDLPD